MIEYYVVRDKNTGSYFRGKGANRWGKHYNQATIYRMKGQAKDSVKHLHNLGWQCEIVPIRIAEIQTDAAEVAQKWIPVTEALPILDDEVLCYKEGRIRIGKYLGASYSKRVGAFKDIGQYVGFGATHWMPLPTPPKE